MNCGTTLEGAACPARGAHRRPPGLPEERRQVTVLFADLSGYTAFAEGMDPEQVKSQVDRALLRLGREVERYGGTVDKYIGDNVMALFGAPVAHEDDAERAVRAGLGMQDAMEEINAGMPPEAEFQLRVGVNTGEVLAGAVGDDYTVMGDTVNVASRLQSAARPGSVTVGERTMRATDDAVSYEALEPLMLKGKAEPRARLGGRRTHRGAPRAARGAGAESPLVGREDELTPLDSLYGRVMHDGDSHLVTLSARRAWASRASCVSSSGASGARPARPRSEPGAASPTAPASCSGRSARCSAPSVESSTRTPPRRRGASFAPTWRADGRERQDLGPRGGADRPPARRGRPSRARAGGARPRAHARGVLLGAARAVSRRSPSRQPLVIAFEDIHWADHGMLDAIEHLAQWVRAPLMLVCLARDELLDRRRAGAAAAAPPRRSFSTR